MTKKSEAKAKAIAKAKALSITGSMNDRIADYAEEKRKEKAQEAKKPKVKVAGERFLDAPPPKWKRRLKRDNPYKNVVYEDKKK